MKKYRLSNKKEQQVSDEDISKYKDFGRVVTNYDKALKTLHKKPLYKDPRAFLGLVVIIVVVFAVVESTDPEHASPDQENPALPADSSDTDTLHLD